MTLQARKKWLPIGFVIAVGLLLASMAVFPNSRERYAHYREVQVTRGPLVVDLVALGVIQPQTRVGVKPPISGRAEEVLVKEGDRVKRGQVLAWMSSLERAALLDVARSKGPAELKEWEELYRPTPVLAPIDGTVILRKIEAGQSFWSSDALFDISDRLAVKALVDETDIAHIKIGQTTVVTLDAYSDNSLTGYVDHIAFDAKTINSVTTYEVDVIPKDAPDFMRSGMTASVTFDIANKQDVILVDAEAVRVKDGKAIVTVPAVSPGLRPFDREIKVGLSDGKLLEVVSGLSDGEIVLIREAGRADESSKSRGLLAPSQGAVR